MQNSVEPEGRLALITGASRGIGRACALQLALDGFDLAFCYHRAKDAADSLEREIQQLGRRSYIYECDVSDMSAVERMLDDLDEKAGEIDVIVNNAGIIKDNPIVLMSKESWDRVIEVNLDGVFNICRRAVFQFMKRKRGCIINMSSVAGVFGNPSQVNYSASKAGVIGFSKALAKEVGPYGIRVNVVAPGFIRTDMTTDLPKKVVDRVMQNIPLKRLGEPADVAQLVSFLASDCARYITAQVIHVDGGVMI